MRCSSSSCFVPFVAVPLLSVIFVLFGLLHYITIYQELTALAVQVKSNVNEFSVVANKAWEQLMEANEMHINSLQKRSVTKKTNFIKRILRDPLHQVSGLPFWCQCEPIVPRCPPGPPGRPGFKGDVGQPGLPGRRGIDNFETLNAKKCIFRERLACIMCPRGPPGRRGRMGPPGESGIPGERGLPGLFFLSKNTFRGPPGEPGEPGRPGSPGRPGEDGKDGRNGYKLKPDKVFRGPPGPPGSRGPQGSRGLPGDFGVPGPMGPPGLKGENGRKGASGIPGRSGRHGRPGGDDSYCPCPARSISLDNFKKS